MSMMHYNSTNSIPNGNGSVHMIMFILLLIVEIPSILCTFFILTFFFFYWHSMMTRALRNHAIFLLIIVSLLYIIFDLPFTINYYRLGYNNPRTPSFCLWWFWMDYTLLLISLFLTAIVSIQRHILVFNARWLNQPRKRWILHYIPLILCIFYPSIYYLIFIYFYPCEIFDENSLTCPFPCYSKERILFYVDWIFNIIFPVVIIVVANVALICRVIYSMNKLRRRQSRTWKRRRKLTLQLLAFSSLYVIGWSPSTVISIIQMFFLPNLYKNAPDLYYINNSTYFVCPLQPFICLFALPEMWKLVKNKLTRRRTLTSITISELRDNRT